MTWSYSCFTNNVPGMGVCPQKRKAPGLDRGQEEGPPEGGPLARESALRERGSLSSRSLALQYFRRRRA